ncbi:MAG: ATP-binding protein [Bacillota bacterium]
MSVNPYQILAEWMEYPNSKRLLDILEFMLTPEQATICTALPGSPQEIAEKVGISAEKAAEELDELFLKGVVFIRGDLAKRQSFRFARTIGQLHDSVQSDQRLDPIKDKKFYEMWHEFCLEEWYPDFARMFANSETPMGRVMPAYLAIKDLPDIQPWEDVREVLKVQDKIAIVPCTCRYRTHAVGQPCHATDELSGWTCIQFGKAADYTVLRGSGKIISQEEALALVERCEMDGLVHTWAYDRRMSIYTFCNCCNDCCIIFYPLQTHGVPNSKGHAPSRYAPEVDKDACNGCQNCFERCQFDAIDMVKNGGKKLKAEVNVDNCLGCGVCVLKCDTGAIKMQCIRPIDFIPESAEGAHL